MPIPLAKLQQAGRSTRDRILDFLRGDPTQAYTAVEIYGGIEGLSQSALAVLILLLATSTNNRGMADLKDTLKQLDIDGLVRATLHQGSTYFSLNQP